MSKSLYQYRIKPEERDLVEVLLNGAIPMQQYKSCGHSNLFSYGNGWFSAKRRIQYKIVGDMLNICVWKVVAPIVPMWEMGCNDASNMYGGLLNTGMRMAVERAVASVGQQCEIMPVTVCQTVRDNFLDLI